MAAKKWQILFLVALSSCWACVRMGNAPLAPTLPGTNIVLAQNIAPSTIAGTWRLSSTQANSIFAGTLDRNNANFNAIQTSLIQSFNALTFTWTNAPDGSFTCALNLGNLNPAIFFNWIDQTQVALNPLGCEIQAGNILVFADNATTPLLTLSFNITSTQLFLGFVDQQNQNLFTNATYRLQGLVWIVLYRS